MTTDATAGGRPLVLVSFHAHPDDESLLTGGTLAEAARRGHRVVVVTATDGARGLAGPDDGHGAELALLRTRELREAAAALGCARVVCLGYGDSGLVPSAGDGGAFVHVDVEVAAGRLAEVLLEEQADVLTTYDPRGGYGHPDHVHVNRVGRRAAELARTPLVLEATVSADAFRRVLAVLRFLGHPLGRSAPLGTHRVFSSRGEITHRVRVTPSLRAKRAAMAAHGTQRRASGEVRAMDRFLRLPLPVFGLVFGREWFVERGGQAPPVRRRDLAAALLGGRP